MNEYYENNIDRQLLFEMQHLRRSINQCYNMIYMLHGQLHNMQSNMLQSKISDNQPLKIENVHILNDINIDELKVNSIQSGASLNVGECICSNTDSDMDMKTGANSMNSGDSNHMECTRNDDIFGEE